MRILLYTTSPQDAVGGMEVVFAGLVDGLRSLGHRVDVVYEGEDFVHTTGEQGDTWSVPLARPQTWHKLPKLGSMTACVASARRVGRVLREVRPDVVNVHYADTTAAYFAMLRPVFGYQLVISAHGSDLLTPFGAVQRLIVPRVLRQANAVMTVSKALTERAVDLGGQAHAVLNGIDHDFWSALPREESAEPVVVAVGRLHPVKGQDVLIDAFARVAEAMPAARLWLVGDGNERPALEEQARFHGIGHKVQFCGWLDRREVRAILAHASLFVLPSRSEGLSLALIEALAAGVPAVATDVGGVSEVIRSDEEGMLVQPEDPTALAEAMQAVLSDPARRQAMSRASRARSRAFSLEGTLKTYERVFADLCMKQHSSTAVLQPD